MEVELILVKFDSLDSLCLSIHSLTKRNKDMGLKVYQFYGYLIYSPSSFVRNFKNEQIELTTTTGYSGTDEVRLMYFFYTYF